MNRIMKFKNLLNAFKIKLDLNILGIFFTGFL